MDGPSTNRFGNRRNQNVVGGTGPGVSLTIDPNTNRIQDTGYAYDSSGNMTNDTFHSYAYDGENRTTMVDSTAAAYTYSGALRVKKVVGTTTTVYVFSGSKVIAEYANGTLSKEYVYAGSTLLATLNADGSVASYEHPDHLSTRVETDANGITSRTFGHFPFGETWYETGSASKWKFTSYERDDESGLDQAVFRYDSSRLGRFMNPDPLGGSVFDPQSLNRYAYANNDPTNLIDPLGLTAPQVKPYDPYADSGWTSLTLLELLSTIASTSTSYTWEWRYTNEGIPYVHYNYTYGNSWVLGLIVGAQQPGSPSTPQGGGTAGKPEKSPEEKARDKKYQECLDKAAAQHTRDLAALSLLLNTRLALTVGTRAVVGGAMGLAAGIALRSPALMVFGTLAGAAAGAGSTAAVRATADAYWTIPRAQARIDDAYMNRVLNCIISNSTPRPPQ